MKQNVTFVKKDKKKLAKDKNYWKVGQHRHFTFKYRDTAHNVFNLRFNVPREILVLLHNGSNYDYYFIIKKLANDF